MKKLIMVVAIVATVGGFAIASGQYVNQGNMMGNGQAYNQNMMGPCNGQGYGKGYRHGKGRFNGQYPCNGQGYNKKHGHNGKKYGKMPQQCGNIKQLSEKEVKAEVEKVIKADFKDLKITSIDKFKMPRGVVYTVNVKDKKGQTSIFHVNPWGNVVGPFSSNK